MELLKQNAKMKKSSAGIFYNFGIPAFRSTTGLVTCPSARNCVSGCYARSGTYGFSNVKAAYEARLTATLLSGFVGRMVAEIESKLVKAKGKQVFIRVHDSGDFYSKEYQQTWYNIARFFLDIPSVKFYAYTKQVSQTKSLVEQQPANFHVLFSFGGKEDHLINPLVDCNAQVFESLGDLVVAGYVDGSEDDAVAAVGTRRVGLVYHGTKKFSNTTWHKQEINSKSTCTSVSASI